MPNSKYRSLAFLPTHHHRGSASHNRPPPNPLSHACSCTSRRGSQVSPQGGTKAASAVRLQSLFPSPRRLLVPPYKPRSSAFRQEPQRLTLDAPARPQLRAPLSRASRRESRKRPHRAWMPFSKLLASLTCPQPWMRATSRRPSKSVAWTPAPHREALAFGL